VLAIKKIIKSDDIKNIRIPKEMGEYIEVIMEIYFVESIGGV